MNNEYTGFIYEWENLINGKKYIGSHAGREDDGYIGSGFLFKKAIKKYGIANFKRIILEFVASKDDLLIREKYWLDKTNAYFDKNYYNIAKDVIGGNTKAGWTEERRNIFKERIREVWAKRTSEERNIILSKARQKQIDNAGGYDKWKIKAATNFKRWVHDRGIKPSKEKMIAGAIKAKETLGLEGRKERARKSLQNRCPIKWRKGLLIAIEKTKKIRANWSAEKKAKVFENMSKSRKGKYMGSKNPNAKQVQIDGVVYETFNKAMEVLNICDSSLRYRLKSNKFPEWNYVISE